MWAPRRGYCPEGGCALRRGRRRGGTHEPRRSVPRAGGRALPADTCVVLRSGRSPPPSLKQTCRCYRARNDATISRACRDRTIVAVQRRSDGGDAPSADDGQKPRIPKGDREAVQVALSDPFAAPFHDRFLRRPDRKESVAGIGRGTDDVVFLGGKIAPRQGQAIVEPATALDVDADWC